MARALRGIAVLAAGGLAVSLLAAAPAERAAAQNIVGWTCLPTFGRCDAQATVNKTLPATVGRQFEVRPAAICATGPWNLNWVEIPGSLPPGLFLDPSVWAILGVPTQAGNFPFEVVFHGISCPASSPPQGDHKASITIVVSGG